MKTLVYWLSKWQVLIYKCHSWLVSVATSLVGQLAAQGDTQDDAYDL